MTCEQQSNTGCNQDNCCENQIASPSIMYGTDDCGTCGGLNTYWTMENFYRSVLRQKITATELPPFTVNVNKLPFSQRGLMTLSPNSDVEEVIEYSYETGNAGNPGQITVLKRGIHPGALNLVVDGQGGNSTVIDLDGEDTLVAPEYNNCNYMFEHLTNSEVQRDITAQDFNIFSRFTCCIPATMNSLGIVALTTPPDNPEFPIAVGANDFANCDKNSGILRGLSKCVPDGEEIAVSWNDYATHTRAGLVTIKDIETESITCDTGSISTDIHNGTIVERALHADQRAFSSIYGSVKLSKNQLESIALSATDYAGNLNAGIVKIKTANSNPTCNAQASDDNQECPSYVKEVIQKDDFANTTQSGVVYLSKDLNNTFPCPVVVTKHDFATKDNTGIVRVEDYCPVGDGYAIVPSMCTYANNDKLGLVNLTVDTTDIDNHNADVASVDYPIAVSTHDKRNFRPLTVLEKNFTDENQDGEPGDGVGALIPISGIGLTFTALPFFNPGFPGSNIGFLTNVASGLPNDINNGTFYGFTDMVSDTEGRYIDIPHDGHYDVSFRIKFRNTESQLTNPTYDPLTDSTTITYSSRIKKNDVNTECGDLQTIMNTHGDPSYNVIDARYGESIRTCILDGNDTFKLQAGDRISLGWSIDNTPCYLLEAMLSVEMRQIIL